MAKGGPAALALAVVCLAGSCRSRSEPPGHGARLRFWHTFSPAETEALNAFLSEQPTAVAARLLPFARAQRVVQETLAAGADCPDLVRVDATWLPALLADDFLRPAPDWSEATDWLPEARALAGYGGRSWGVPLSIDGLALLYDPDRLAAAALPWPPTTLGDLVAAAQRLTADSVYGLAARIDGYWFTAFLRGWGGDILDPESGALGVDKPEAAAALERFAALFGAGGVAPPRERAEEEARVTARRFRRRGVAVVVEGPWAVADLQGGLGRLDVAPFPTGPDGQPAAPRGGQVLVVPRCAREPELAWGVARALADPELQAAWSRALGTIPTTETGLRQSGRLARRFRTALGRARPLPRHPITAQLFDDLTPAVAAAVAGDASASEALAGVARAWRRRLRRMGAP